MRPAWGLTTNQGSAHAVEEPVHPFWNPQGPAKKPPWEMEGLTSLNPALTLG